MCLGCCSVVVLEDSDVVHLTRGGYAIYNAAREDPAACVPRLLRTLDMEVSSIMKGGYDHYMQKEIHEQPESILQTMRGRVKFSRVVPKVCCRTLGWCELGNLVIWLPAHPQKLVHEHEMCCCVHTMQEELALTASGCTHDVQDGEAWDPYMERRIKLGGLAEYIPTIRRGRRLMFVACGTSYHACLACRQTMEEIAEMPVWCFPRASPVSKLNAWMCTDAPLLCKVFGQHCEIRAQCKYVLRSKPTLD